MSRINISSGTDWEKEVGYSRLVKVENNIFVSGTTAVDESGNIIGLGDVYQQAKYIFMKIEKSLTEVGASLSDVVRTKMYVTNIDQWEKVGKAHGEFFKDITPASTMIEVSSLIHEDLLVEIELEAIINGSNKL